MATTRNPVLVSQQMTTERQSQAESRDFLTVSDVLLQNMVSQYNLNDPTISAGIARMDQTELVAENGTGHLPLDLFQGLYTFDSQPLELPYLQWPWWPMQAVEEMDVLPPETIPQGVQGDCSLSLRTYTSAVALPSSDPSSGSSLFLEPQHEVYASLGQRGDKAPSPSSSRSITPGSVGKLEESDEPDSSSKRCLSDRGAMLPKTHQKRKHPCKTPKGSTGQQASSDGAPQPNRSRRAKRDATLDSDHESSNIHCRPTTSCESEDEDASEMENTRRRRLTPEETEYLLRKFHQIEKPSAKERLQFAEDLKLTPRTIQIWFQNRRAKLKKETRLVREIYSKELSEKGDSSAEEPDSGHAAQVGDGHQTATAWLDPPILPSQTDERPSQLYCSDWNEIQSNVGMAPFYSFSTIPSFETILSQQAPKVAEWLKVIDSDIGIDHFDVDSSLLTSSDAWPLQTISTVEPRYVFEDDFPFSSLSPLISSSRMPKEQASRSGEVQSIQERQASFQGHSRGQRNGFSGTSLARTKDPVPRHQRALTLVEVDPDEHES